MNKGKIRYAGIAMLLVFFSACSPALKEGVQTQVGRQSLKKYWTTNDCNTSGGVISLETTNSLLTSRFEVRNFILTAKLMTTSGAEGALLFHVVSGNSEEATGYSVIINNSDYRKGSPQKTGSLSLIRNNFVRTASDDIWFDLSVAVRGNHITVTVDKKIVIDYIQPGNPDRIEGLERRLLSRGLVFLQKSNDAGSIQVDDISIELLADNIEFENPDPVTSDTTGKLLSMLNQQGFPVIDYHGHLKGGLTVEQVSQHGMTNGYNYGISPNCGLNFPVTNDSSLIAYFIDIENEPVFKAMQCEGREWITLFTPDAIARYDYIFTDAMTWTDHKGRRLRLWIPEETFVDNEQQFMDMLVEKIEAVISQEPVDIYVNPTYLPANIAASYDRLWTAERMDRVIKVLKENDVALEINARFKIPGIDFIKKAKAAGLKFTFGTNNADNTDLNRLEYCLEVVRETGITAEDIFIPRPSGEKKVMKKGLPAKITG
ncbi:MAG TPA: family 16 glycoside hydrolase [Bacteroidales bacterium]|nr:family 16 glycoside hydrolase [Bacteroidales bacterium]